VGEPQERPQRRHHRLRRPRVPARRPLHHERGHLPAPGPATGHGAANGATRRPAWKPTRSASSPTSPGQDGRSPDGRSSWPGCAERPSWSAPPATRPSTTGTLPPSRRNRWRASCWETSPRGSDRGLLGKGPASGGHLASGLPVCRVSKAGERQGLNRDELYVNLGCLRKRAQLAGV